MTMRIETRPYAVAFQGHGREVIDTMGVEWPYSETIVLDLADEGSGVAELCDEQMIRELFGLQVFDALVEGLGR